MKTPKPRPSRSTYTDEKADMIIESVSDGVPLAQVCRDIGLGLTTWYDWTYARPDLAERFRRAREAGFDMIALDTLRISDTPVEAIIEKSTAAGIEITRQDALGHRKLQIDTRLKLLAKWDPKRYGDKLAIGGASDLPPIQSTATIEPSEAYKKLLEGAGGEA